MQGIVAFLTIDQVGSCISFDIVITGASINRIIPQPGINFVIPLTSIQRVVTAQTCQHIITDIPDKCICGFASQKRIIAGLAKYLIGAIALCPDIVVAIAPCERIGTGTAKDRIIAILTIDQIVTAPTAQ